MLSREANAAFKDKFPFSPDSHLMCSPTVVEKYIILAVKCSIEILPWRFEIVFLADPGRARGCLTNTVLMHKLIK